MISKSQPSYLDSTDRANILSYSSSMSFSHILCFNNFNIVATQCRRPLIFRTMNAIRSNNVSLKYQKFTS